MTTKINVFLIVFLYSLTLKAQILDNGVYSNGYKCYICILNDTLLYCDGDSYWYIGSYQIKKSKLIWGENYLTGRNVTIIKTHTTSNDIELHLITKRKHYNIGAPSSDTTIYEEESDIYAMIIDKTRIVSKNKNGIIINRGLLPKEFFENGFYLDDSSSGFFDYFNIPLEYGSRYIVTQKYYNFNPMILYSYKYSKIKYNKRKKEILIKLQPKDKHYSKYKYISSNCDSCFKEFKNRFPLLFE